MSINLQLPDSVILKPCITVFGVGGAGCNAVNNMINANLEGAKFVVANTDSQALHLSNAENKIQLGANITKGLGAGAAPEIGRAAAEEAMEEIESLLNDSNMVFITAGMGGGTGTGAAPVIAKLARERGILTVGVVTKPFHFEGIHRMRLADSGLNELQKFVDTLIVIPNQNLFKIANAKTTFADAFKMADDVLHSGVRGITDLMIMPGLINLDFADIKTVMGEMGKAMMGTGEAQGENRAIVAAEAAISNPLLDHCSMKGAKGVLINISGGYDMTLFEVDEAANRIREEVDPEANIIFGSAFNSELDGTIRVSVVATGIEQPANQTTKAQAPVQPSTIQQMQQLYKAEQKPAPIFQTLPVAEKEDKYPGVFFSPRPIDPNNEEPFIPAPAQEEPAEQEVIKTPVKAQASAAPKETPKSSFSLFGRMANSMMRGSKQEEQEEDESIYILSEEKNNSSEDEMITEEMLNIPAYQRRK
jgi:cell division protein FtsZ